MKEQLTTQEAADILGVSASRVRQFIQQKRLKSEKLGRDHLISRSELSAFIAEGPIKRGRPPNNKKACASVRN